MKKAAVIMGSESDLPVAQQVTDQLRALGIPTQMHIFSAHRTPQAAANFAEHARENGFGVLIAAAGMSAHLAGALAARTVLPVIGIPLKSGALNGWDALFSTVQMPSGIPVATVAVDGAKNAAILAAEILATEDEALGNRLLAMREEMTRTVLQKDAALARKKEQREVNG